MVKYSNMSRRERQVMDAVYKLEKASAKEVMAYLDDDSAYSTIRTLLGKLLAKGHINRKEHGLKYLYFPVVKRKAASRNALERVVSTFFDDSPLLAVNSLLEMKKGGITEEEIKSIEALIKKKKDKT